MAMNRLANAAFQLSAQTPAHAGLSARPLRHGVLQAAQLRCAPSNEQPGLRDFISQQFAQAYGARLREFLPQLLSVSCNNRPRATLGLRAADASTSLFLEQYLPQPVEQMLAASTGYPVEREHIVEVGNLVATRRGASQLLFVIAAAAMHQAGTQWMVFTATDAVQDILAKMHFKPLELGVATSNKLSTDGSEWGSYYATRPVVLAGNISLTLRQIRQHGVLRKILESNQSSIDEAAAQLMQQAKAST